MGKKERERGLSAECRMGERGEGREGMGKRDKDKFWKDTFQIDYDIINMTFFLIVFKLLQKLGYFFILVAYPIIIPKKKKRENYVTCHQLDGWIEFCHWRSSKMSQWWHHISNNLNSKCQNDPNIFFLSLSPLFSLSANNKPPFFSLPPPPL